MADQNNLVIPAEVHSDDHVKQANFDALPWFEQANDQQIMALARCDWGGDYPADDVAHECSDQPHVEAILDWAADEQIGFECHVDEQAAMKWLKQNRPARAKDIENEQEHPAN